jgi:hypothetical protein
MLEKERYDEEGEEFNIFFILNEYADNHPEFKSKFLDGVRDFYYSNGFITSSQLGTLRDVLSESNQSLKKCGMEEIQQKRENYYENSFGLSY